MKRAFQGCLYLSQEFNKSYFWPRVISPTPAQEVGYSVCKKHLIHINDGLCISFFYSINGLKIVAEAACSLFSFPVVLGSHKSTHTMSYFHIRHSTDRGVLAKAMSLQPLLNVKVKTQKEISLLLPSLRILPAWRKPPGPKDHSKKAVVLLSCSGTEDRYQFPNALISADTRWTADPQKCCIFCLKCIILIFFSSFGWFFLSIFL